MKSFIPFALPDIDECEISEVVDTLKSNWITTGPKTKLFEKNFSDYIGAPYALAVNSATSGLHLALECIGLNAGDVVITTPYTFTATAEVVSYFEAVPVFIDIDEKTLNINPEKIREFCEKECILREDILYYKKTQSPVKAILPVHIGGYPCDMDKILDLAKQYHLKVIEDAAHALPSFYKGKKIGTLSDITVFSFYATKSLTTAEGGMVVTRNSEYYNRMKIMSLHGIERDAWGRYSSEIPSWYYEIIDAGFKYNMTDISASLGIQQLKKIDIFYQKRKDIAFRYQKELANISEIELPLSYDGHSWHLYIIKLKSKHFLRDEIIKKMFEAGIGVSVHFIPLHLHPYYKKKYGYLNEDFPIAYGVFKKVISLPIYTKMIDEDVTKVIKTLKKIFL